MRLSDNSTPNHEKNYQKTKNMFLLKNSQNFVCGLTDGICGLDAA
jgi:hypothetical protein